MRNQRLERALIDAQLTVEDLAQAIQVDIKTVRRWVEEGRVPYPRHRLKITPLLNQPAEVLWESLADNSPPRIRTASHLKVHLEPSDLPDWRTLAATATRHLDMFGLTLRDTLQNQSDVRLLAERADAGADVRVLISAQDSLFIHHSRQRAPGSPSPLHVDLARTRELLNQAADSRLDIRSFVAAPGYTILRFDDHMLVDLGLDTEPGVISMLEITATGQADLFSRFVEHFNVNWPG